MKKRNMRRREFQGSVLIIQRFNVVIDPLGRSTVLSTDKTPKLLIVYQSYNAYVCEQVLSMHALSLMTETQANRLATEHPALHSMTYKEHSMTTTKKERKQHASMMDEKVDTYKAVCGAEVRLEAHPSSYVRGEGCEDDVLVIGAEHVNCPTCLSILGLPTRA